MKLIIPIALSIFLFASTSCGAEQVAISSPTTVSESVKTTEPTPGPTPTPELFTSSEFGKNSYITGLGGIDAALLGSPSWMTFIEAKEFIETFGLTTESEFREWASTNERPSDFPSRPAILYTDEWSNWVDFLGNNN